MKLNKYTVRATAQVITMFIFAGLISCGISLVLNYINPTGAQLIGTMAGLFLAFCVYNLIQIQASILESKDKLNNK
jgi:hypothetical protein